MAGSSSKDNDSGRSNPSRMNQGVKPSQIDLRIRTTCEEPGLLVLYPGSEALASGSKKVIAYAVSPEDARYVATIRKLTDQYNDICERLEVAKLQTKQLEDQVRENLFKGLTFSDRPFEELSLEELTALRTKHLQFKEKLLKLRQEHLDKAAASASASTGGSNGPLNGSTDAASSSAEPNEP